MNTQLNKDLLITSGGFQQIDTYFSILPKVNISTQVYAIILRTFTLDLTVHSGGYTDGDVDAARAAPDGPESRAIFYPTRPNTQELYHQTEDLCKSRSKSAPVNCLRRAGQSSALLRWNCSL